ncbi:hypothetical protein ACWN8V_06425 [Vagococcus elongatus]|uniref:Uncharacterized protein n=1 Tax=Vagococcus elongatus TaxID=180344 RepID=A0A430B160_9ENTE|nr:hypothetical protein [Vagococcus elongatus]RSU14077.1 hypothetical protein CBF29_04120 [Vagococcus elongatus]
MKTQTFREFSKKRILPAIIEIDGQKFPNVSVKLPPYCYLTFNERDISVNNIVPLTSQKGKEVLEHLPYAEIEKVEINPVQKLTVVIIAPGTRINLDLKLLLTDGTQFHFECEDMTMLPKLASIFSSHYVPVTDSFGLVEIFKTSASNRAAYDYLEENAEVIAAQKNLKILRVTQMEE